MLSISNAAWSTLALFPVASPFLARYFAIVYHPAAWRPHRVLYHSLSSVLGPRLRAARRGRVVGDQAI